jgi:RNA recognition motif-containing protein
MNKRLYVGGLSYETTEEALRNLFDGAGSVESVDLIRDRYTDRPRGFGFVEMETVNDAEKAVEALNGTTLDGRMITVAEARPRREKSKSSDRWDRW